MAIDPYKILGLKPGATAAEIRKAYLNMSKKYHPDTGGDAWVFQQIRAAYEELTQPTKDQQPFPDHSKPPESGPSPNTHDEFSNRQRRSHSSNAHSSQSRPFQNRDTGQTWAKGLRTRYVVPFCIALLLVLVISGIVWFYQLDDSKNQPESISLQSSSITPQDSPSAKPDSANKSSTLERASEPATPDSVRPELVTNDQVGKNPESRSAEGAQPKASILREDPESTLVTQSATPTASPQLADASQSGTDPTLRTDLPDAGKADEDVRDKQWNIVGLFRIEMTDVHSKVESTHLYEFLQDGTVLRNNELWGKWIQTAGGYRLNFRNPNRGHVDIQMTGENSLSGLHHWKSMQDGRDKSTWKGTRLVEKPSAVDR